MIKRLQISMSEEAWAIIEKTTNEASENFDAGTITYSDVICEMILNAKIDIKSLQLKRTDLRRSLKSMANNPDIDIDTIIKNLNDLKARTKRHSKSTAQGPEVPA